MPIAIRQSGLSSLLLDCIYAIIAYVNVVVDTDVWVAGVRGSGHANRVLRLCLEGRFTPLMGAALLAEYEDLLGRESIWRGARLTTAEREAFLDIFLSICQWTRIYYAWRPNLGDEADNHLIELAVAGQANYLVTRNVRHLRGGELKFPHISVVTPTQLLKEQA
ncbi:MAG: putative toxin-antitoxin system toxin component, PIN family [Steroidobacteraceae bacterium]